MEKRSFKGKRSNSFLDFLKDWQSSGIRHSQDDPLLENSRADVAHGKAEGQSLRTDKSDQGSAEQAVLPARDPLAGLHPVPASWTIAAASMRRDGTHPDDLDHRMHATVPQAGGDSPTVSATKLAGAIRRPAVNQVSATLDQWADGPAPDGDSSGAKDEAWVNGNLNASKAHYNEGDAIPYRALLDNLVNGTRYGLQIQWDTVDSGALAYALDYLVGYNYSFEGLRHSQEPEADPLKGIVGLGPTAVSAEILGDGKLRTGFGYGTTDGLDSDRPSGNQTISLYGSVDSKATVDPVVYSDDLRKASTTIWFTYTGAGNSSGPDVVVAWGGHIAAASAWADDPGESVITASAINGSPYHMRILSMNVGGSVVQIGNQDRSLSADAVEVPDIPPPVLVLDDEILLGGIAGGPDDGTPFGDIDPQSSPSPDTVYIETGVLLHPGATAIDTTLLTSVDPDSDASLRTELSMDGKSLKVWQVDLGSADEPALMMDLSDATSGAYILTYLKPFVHPLDNGLESEILLKVNYTVTYASLGGIAKVVPLTILIDDDTPTVSQNKLVKLDDDALTGGNPDGAGDDTDAENTSGTLGHSFGADGAGSIAYLTTGAPSGFTYALSGTDLLIKQDGTTTTVLTLTVNSSTGEYTVSQNNPIQHVAGLSENNQGFEVTYEVTDRDGDKVTNTLAIDVDDDEPAATTAYEEADLTLDEDDLALGSDASKEATSVGGDIFDATGVGGFTYGADGGSLTGVQIGADVYSIAEGQTSVTVYFAQDGASQGISETNAAASLQVNADGTYTFNLLDNLLLSDVGDPTQQIESLNDVVGTIALLGEDNDGDAINSGKGISLTLKVVDDEPAATTAYEEADLTLDEDDLALGSDASKEATSVGGDIFDATGVGGFTYGADGGSLTGVQIGADVYSIAEGQTSVTVYFAQDGASQGISETNAAASLQVNADGTYTFNLLDNLLLSDVGDPTQQIESLNDVVGTIALLGEDNDGDAINSGKGISLTLKVVDDVPAATTAYEEADLTLDEDDLALGSDASKEATSVGGDIFDATGVGGFTYGADGGSLTGVQIGADVYSIAEGQTSVTVYFAQDGASQGISETNAAASLQVNADGTYTFNLLDNLLLSDVGDPTQQIESLNDVVGTIALLGEDNDGDAINSGKGISLTLKVVDDVPAATTAYEEADLTLDEDDLALGSDASKEATSVGGDIFDATGVGGFTYGADGGSLTGVQIGADVYSIAEGQTSVTVYFAQDGASQGISETNAAASLQVNADGTYTFNLLDNLLLSDVGDPTQQIESLNDVVGTIALLGEDNDGDAINSGKGISLTLKVVDDVPAATTAYEEADLTLDEDDLALGSDASKEATSVGGDIFDATGVGGFTYGADGGSLTGVQIGADVYSIAEGQTSVTVYFAQDGASQGISETNAAASLQVNADGTYTFNLLDNLLLSDVGDPTQQIESLNDVVGTIALLGEDNDGDAINSGKGISLTLKVVDDVPAATTAYEEADLTLDEDDLALGSDASKEATSVGGDIFDATGVGGFTYGADGGSLTGVQIGADVYSIAEGQTSVTVYFAQDGASQGISETNAAASLQVNADGTYTFNLLDNLLLSDVGDPTQQIESLNDVVGTIALLGEDNDGDAINSGKGISLTLKVVDDVPAATTAYEEADLTLDEDDLALGSDASKEATSVGGDIFDATGVGGFTYGADGGSLTGVQIGADVYSIAEGQTSVTVYFAQDGASQGISETNAAASLQVNADGTYTFNLLDNLLLSDVGDPTQQIESLNDVVGTIALLGEDNDGDAINSGKGISLTLKVVDDVPAATTAYEEADLTLDEDDLALGSDASKEATSVGGDIFDATGVGGFTYGADGGSLTGVQIGADVYSIAEGQTSVTVYFAQDGASQGISETNAAASLQVNADGTYTFNLLDNLLLSDVGDPTQQIESLNDVVGTIALLGEDNDGDAINSGKGISLTLKVVDDVPAATTAYEEADLTLDEDDLALGSDASKEATSVGGDIFDATGVGGFTYGADGGSLTGVQIGADVYSIAEGQTSVTVYFAQDGASQGISETNAAASLQVNADGTYTFNLLDNLLLSDVGDPTQQIESLNDVVGTIALLGEDNDGDAINSGKGISLTLKVVDDVPAATGAITVKLDDDALTGGNPDGAGDDIDADNTSGTLGHSFGADGAGSIAYLTTGAPSGFTYALSGTDLLIKQDGTTVLTLTVNSSTGEYMVSQNNPIQHVAGLSENNQGFEVTYEVTDRDGDKVTNKLAIDVDDDTPLINSDLPGDPTIGTIEFTSPPGSATTKITGNYISWRPGADIYGGLAFTGFAAGTDTKYDYNTLPSSGATSGITINITYDADGAGDKEAQTIAQYIFDAVGEDTFTTYDYQGIFDVSPTQLEAGAGVKPGGPHPIEFKLFDFDGVANDLVVMVSGGTRSGTALTSSDYTPGLLNTSAQGYAAGDGDQNLEYIDATPKGVAGSNDTKETIKFTFATYDQPASYYTGLASVAAASYGTASYDEPDVGAEQELTAYKPVAGFGFDFTKLTGGSKTGDFMIKVTYQYDGGTDALSYADVYYQFAGVSEDATPGAAYSKVFVGFDPDLAGGWGAISWIDSDLDALYDGDTPGSPAELLNGSWSVVDGIMPAPDVITGIVAVEVENNEPVPPSPFSAEAFNVTNPRFYSHGSQAEIVPEFSYGFGLSLSDSDSDSQTMQIATKIGGTNTDPQLVMQAWP